MAQPDYILWFDSLNNQDVDRVGGKNASLGELISGLKSQGIQVPDGFALTATAYRSFLAANDLEPQIQTQLRAFSQERQSLAKTGKTIRRLFQHAAFPQELETAIRRAYRDLSRRYQVDEADTAVRSSATAEDLPDASFAGQQETFLNVSGDAEVLDACRRCYASLFTNRAISYREEKGFDHLQVALSVGVQKMVRADQACAGVMFSIDTETGFPDVTLITGSWGLGETVVQGAVTPDQFTVFKPLLQEGFRPIIEKTKGSKLQKMVYGDDAGKDTIQIVETTGKERQAFVISDDEILQLARWAVVIEDHYGRPMDMEWAKDGNTGELFIVQARPETVQSQRQAGTLKTYKLKQAGEVLLTGLSIGDAIASGRVCRVLSTKDIDQVEDGSILVTEMTDPDWVPVMKRVAGIVTDYGGRTCHAAIVSRELGIPAIVGTGDASRTLHSNQDVTLSCAEGDQGKLYAGQLEFEAIDVTLDDIPATRTKIMMNIASPAAAFHWWQLPVEGIGLARMEFIINTLIKIHPMALVNYDNLQDRDAWKTIRDLTKGYGDKREYFVDNLCRGIGKIAASQYPHPVIVRLSDFKTNEYADLIGGREFEGAEANPMLGFRGAARYYSPRYREGFALECQAIKRVREVMGFDNVIVMVPFCRKVAEADRVLQVLVENGLKQGVYNLQIYVMCEIPANVLLAEQFAQRFDGFSIGSNDLTQLILGVDRDSGELADLFDETDAAVTLAITKVITAAHKYGRKVGICGQGPSDKPEFAAFLVKAGIDSMSLNPDSVVQVKRLVAEQEAQLSA
ncbi:Phosphoenolpyruvate synthase [Halomicronema hongdechloris C2206]|uniref:Phosphoenolpyruvate synthase n=1 Tax=Halomicronema hongdechloris C2206 TaxID=1641165 RepID=A0A1Z3HRW7_9CYAN|nr:phosphoenolpyruvate synthase [Halomicronema hongdechloris]ASC73053.1 Phosphoenolpyruvate synthase [Halomicronema hongdechloris C2206]